MYEFEEDKQEQAEEQLQASRNRDWPGHLVRGIGIVLLLIGLWASIHVLLEALRLYRDPLRIEHMAAAIEKGSNLDRSLQQAVYDESGKSSVPSQANLPGPQSSQGGIRMTYFIAWIFALLLLMLISMIAFAAIRTGSELVLQDAKLKKYLKSRLRQLDRQEKNNRRDKGAGDA